MDVNFFTERAKEEYRKNEPKKGPKRHEAEKHVKSEDHKVTFKKSENEKPVVKQAEKKTTLVPKDRLELSNEGRSASESMSVKYSRSASAGVSVTKTENGTTSSASVSYSESFEATHTRSVTKTGNAALAEKAGATDNKGDTEKTEKKDVHTISAENAKTIERLKADADRRTQQLRELVEKILLKQGKIFKIASDEDMINALKNDVQEVDPEVQAQAAEDISEDGYWGIEQTSERMLDFAMALAGNDSAHADALMDAVKEGYKQAAGIWGDEDSMPELCKKTLERTLEKMEAWKNGTLEELRKSYEEGKLQSASVSVNVNVSVSVTAKAETGKQN